MGILMGILWKLLENGWTIESAAEGGRYQILVRPGAKRIVVDIYWGTAWVSGHQDMGGLLPK